MDLRCLFFLLAVSLSAGTIEEAMERLRKGGSSEISEPVSPQLVSQNLDELSLELKQKYTLLQHLIEKEASEKEYETLLKEVNVLKNAIGTISEKFRNRQTQEMRSESDPAGMWQQASISLAELVMQYGSQDYLYVIPPDIGGMRLEIESSLLIPRSSWGPLLEVVLGQNGIGVKEVNSFARQLYMLKQDFTSISCITTKKVQLDIVDQAARVIHLLTVPGDNLKTTFYFLERFRDPKTTFVYQVGPKIAIVGFQNDVKKLVGLADNVWSEEQQKTTKVVASQKVNPEEMIKILRGYFGTVSDGKSSSMIRSGNELTAIPIKADSNIVLVGPRDVVDKAEDIILQTQAQINDPSEVTVTWYTCAHSAPADLAEVLEKVYSSIVSSTVEGLELAKQSSLQETTVDASYDYSPGGPPQEMLPYQDTPPLGPGRPALPGGTLYDPFSRNTNQFIETKLGPQKPQHFIPYPTTGTILMIVRKDSLGKVKEIIKTLDVPKKMVDIEVILIERTITDSTRSGLNLLKLGTDATTAETGGIKYDASSTALSKGLFEFFFTRTASHVFPAFNIVYNFLLLEEEAKITASPSVTTVNQVPTSISIAEEISINNGSAPVNSNAGIIFKESYDRQTFGIRINITPTIHEPMLDDGDIYVTLENDISFDTFKNDKNDRPNVRKRNVKNNVRVLDGETIVLGGLKTKLEDTTKEQIPFLGELPGIGKFFGTDVLTSKDTEMFIFICPRVIRNPKDDLRILREERMRQRTGDMVELIEQIKESRERQKIKRFKRSFDLFFGRKVDETLINV